MSDDGLRATVEVVDSTENAACVVCHEAYNTREEARQCASKGFGGYTYIPGDVIYCSMETLKHLPFHGLELKILNVNVAGKTHAPKYFCYIIKYLRFNKELGEFEVKCHDQISLTEEDINSLAVGIQPAKPLDKA